MIKIAFCDDELSMLNDMSDLLDRYRVERNSDIEYAAYQSPVELIAAIEKGLRCDILFLDVIMPGQNGIEVAKEIRTYDSNVKIIFLTSSSEFAVQSYTVDAYFYQLKPVCDESFFSVLERAINACMKSQNENIILKCKTGITAVSPQKLEYCEVIGHSLLLHMKNGEVLESTGKLNDLEERLRFLGIFLRVHRSYLVNMAYIKSISYRAVILNCQIEIPIPHGKYNDIKKTYLDYAFEKENMMI